MGVQNLVDLKRAGLQLGYIVVAHPGLEATFTTSAGTQPTWRTELLRSASTMLVSSVVDPVAADLLEWVRLNDSGFVLGTRNAGCSVVRVRHGAVEIMDTQPLGDEDGLANVLLLLIRADRADRADRA